MSLAGILSDGFTRLKPGEKAEPLIPALGETLFRVESGMYARELFIGLGKFVRHETEKGSSIFLWASVLNPKHIVGSRGALMVIFRRADGKEIAEHFCVKLASRTQRVDRHHLGVNYRFEVLP